jgi:hypothetical protein
LSSTEAPYVFARVCSEYERGFYALARYGQMELPDRRVFQVRGRKFAGRSRLLTEANLEDEIGAAFGLDDEFATNVHAMVEHLEDLYTHHPATEFVVVIKNSDVIRDLDYWVWVMNGAGELYAEATNQGAWFDRPAMPFHCVLEVESEGGLDAVCRAACRVLGEDKPVPILGPSPFVQARDDAVE